LGSGNGSIVLRPYHRFGMDECLGTFAESSFAAWVFTGRGFECVDDLYVYTACNSALR
jgi:hypothetical protein